MAPPLFIAQVVESVDTPDLKSVDYCSRASSSLALGIAVAKVKVLFEITGTTTAFIANVTELQLYGRDYYS